MADDEVPEYDIVLKQRSPYLEVFYSREDDETTVVPFPTGTTARAQMTVSGVIALTFECVVDEVLGEVTLAATGTDTATLVSGGRYDIFLDYPGVDDVTPDMFVRGRVKLITASTAMVP